MNRPEIDRTIHVPGRGDMHVRDIAGPAGAPTVILLHGLGATARLNWGPSFRALSEKFRVLAIDHRGHGRGLRTWWFSLEDCADDAAAAADELGIERFIAVGYSMGGPVAKLTWKRHRDRVAGLVLCATAHRFTRGVVHQMSSALPLLAQAVRLMPGRLQDRMLTDMLSRVSDPAMRERIRAELAGHDPATVVQAAGAVGSFTSQSWLEQIDVPTAVIVTNRDRTVPPRRQRRMGALIPDAQVIEIEGDHVACVAAADRFVPVLVEACDWVAGEAFRQR
jgi:pimeloyl-ACP methyl ester carboxylesterase